jgi:hypothetical protein
MSLILYTVHPTMPVDPNRIPWFQFPLDGAILDPLISKVGDILGKTAPVKYQFPPSLVNDRSGLTAEAQKLLKPAADTGLLITSFHDAVDTNVTTALEAADRKDWKQAATLYQAALDQTPAGELAIRGGLLHDLAVLNEEAGNKPKAQEFMQASVTAFTQGKITDGQAQSLATAAGMFTRAGNAQQAAEFTRQLDAIKSTTLLSNVVTTNPFIPRAGAATLILNRPRLTALGHADGEHALATIATVAAPVRTLPLDPAAPELIGRKYLANATPTKTLTVMGVKETAKITPDHAGANGFLQTLSTTADIGLLTGWLTPIHFVAYIPHLYFFVLPMSMGDCHAGMGNLDVARQTYASVLPYPFINKNYEIVKVWTRLAQTHLDLGDRAYRAAKDNAAGFAAAKAYYEAIVKTDKTLDATSPLYADAKFAALKARVVAFLQAANPAQVNDNPSVISLVLQAYAKLQQIKAGLNFFGFDPNYAPPFSFEYLQTTARYFAEHASQTEQRYIQYKSQAENEEFRRDQLDQQAEVARQSVILEQRGVTEAQAGVAVAGASLNYANAQVQAATDAKNQFAATRWELLELSGLEAWSSAASVGEDDEIKQTISGYQYYSSDHKRRSDVLQDLATQRTLITQNLEAARLDQAVATAQAYKGVAQAQVGQAQARVAVAQQRVAIAQLQQRQAEENRDFLDVREFGARLWYELAQQARRITQRYLDMATEIAFLMERAYNAETERNLSVIRYDYHSTAAGNLMGADLLLTDIDSFTLDHLTTVKTKKVPVKKTISLADSYPTQFNRLQTKGWCTFETTLADFDRQHPGLYLAKVRNVEVVFVGLTGVRGVAGTLRNIGVSRFRASNGGTITRLYPADVMVLSQYEIRQDALTFRFNPNDLRLFENNGIDTLWRLDLPLDANDFDSTDILDVHLVLYYDGFFDPSLETQIRAALPANGAAARGVSMKLSSPDELFYLKNQGEAELVFGADDFPRNQKDRVRTTDTIRLTGTPQATQNVKLRLTSDALGAELLLTTDANGEVHDTAAGAPLQGLRNKPVLDRWRIAIRAADNPQLVQNGVLNLSGLDDLMVFFEYKFNYR